MTGEPASTESHDIGSTVWYFKQRAAGNVIGKEGSYTEKQRRPHDAKRLEGSQAGTRERRLTPQDVLGEAPEAPLPLGGPPEAPLPLRAAERNTMAPG